MVRGEIRRAQIDADRARRDAQAADTDEARQRLAERAGMYAQWEQMTRDVAARLAEAQAGYDAWEQSHRPDPGPGRGRRRRAAPPLPRCPHRAAARPATAAA